MKMSSVEK
jgi:hypothetical protein